MMGHWQDFDLDMRVRGLRVAAIERGEQSLSEDEEDQLLYTRFLLFFCLLNSELIRLLLIELFLLFFPNDQMKTATFFNSFPCFVNFYLENFLAIFTVPVL
jgi:hypothetical protein